MLLLVLTALPLWSGCGGLPEDAVAEVDGHPITREKLERMMQSYQQQYTMAGKPLSPDSPEYKETELNAVRILVLTEVGLLEAGRMGIEVSDAEVTEQIDQIIQQYGGEEELNKQLQTYGKTLDDVKDDVYTNLVLGKLATRVAEEVTDDDLLAYYEKNKAQYQNPEETRKVRHILVTDEATAQQVKGRLDAGEDFAALAGEFSTDQGSKENGGLLPVRMTVTGGLVPEFEQTMKQLAPGQTSGLVKTSYGYHIIKVEAIYPPNTEVPFDDARAELRELLKDQQFIQVFLAFWLETKEKNYEIIYADGYNPDQLEQMIKERQQGQIEAQPQATPAP